MLFVLLSTLLPDRAVAAQGWKGPTEESLAYEDYGPVHIYRESEHPANVVLFLSGNAGWRGPVVEMARALASLDSLVIGIDVAHFLKSFEGDGEQCCHYSYSFEDLSHFVQRKLGYPAYVFPILAGYSEGATVAYAALVQSHAGVYRAVLSLAFCPTMVLPKVPCRGEALGWSTTEKGRGAGEMKLAFLPAPGLAAPWIVFQGEADRVCAPAEVGSFVNRCGHARLVTLPKVGHGFSVVFDWMPALKEEYASLIRKLAERAGVPKAPDVRDLPLVEIPAPGPHSNVMAIIVSGDGGWAGIDRDIGQLLVDAGISVVGVNSLQYFWTRRTPETASADLGRVVRHYLAAWNKRRVILAGYSMGADVLTFMANRLPADLLSSVTLIALLGPSPTVDFEFHFTEWFGTVARKSDLPVAPEIARLKGKKVLCVYGVEDGDDFCKSLPPGTVRPVAMEGGHHFDGRYESIVDLILKESQ